MSLESATTISGLQANNPAGSDSQLQGYQHLQLIKSVLKLQFPGIGGAGFSIPITAKESEINSLSGVTSNVQGQLNFLQGEITALQAQGSFPTGTRIVFAQAAAPVGWTQVTAWANHMLRVISGAGGGSGGSTSPIVNNIVPAHSHTFSTGSETSQHTHSLTLDAVPGHTHTVPVSPSAALVTAGGTAVISASSANTTTASSGGHTPTGSIGVESSTHTHSGTTNNNSGGNWTPFYLDTIICEKT